MWVYSLFVDVPEVFATTYDIRALIKATAALRDGDKIQLRGPTKSHRKVRRRLDPTQVGRLLRESGLIQASGRSDQASISKHIPPADPTRW